MQLPPLAGRQLAGPRFAAAGKLTTSLTQRRRYSLRHFLTSALNYKSKGSGNQCAKRGPVVLQYPYRASRSSPQTNQLRSTAPVLSRDVNPDSDFFLPSWRPSLLSPVSIRSVQMSSNTLNLPSKERRPSAVRTTSVAPNNKTRQDIAKKNLRATQFTSMVTNSVNKTALHPGGVEYVAAITPQVHD